LVWRRIILIQNFIIYSYFRQLKLLFSLWNGLIFIIRYWLMETLIWVLIIRFVIVLLHRSLHFFLINLIRNCIKRIIISLSLLAI
jgi:hypothetical protein